MSIVAIQEELTEVFSGPRNYRADFWRVNVFDGSKRTWSFIFRHEPVAIDYTVSLGYVSVSKGCRLKTVSREVFCSNSALTIDSFNCSKETIEGLLTHFERLTKEPLTIYNAAIDETEIDVGWVASPHWVGFFTKHTQK